VASSFIDQNVSRDAFEHQMSKAVYLSDLKVGFGASILGGCTLSGDLITVTHEASAKTIRMTGTGCDSFGLKNSREWSPIILSEALIHGLQHLDIMISLDQLPILRFTWSPETLALVDVHWIAYSP
jgi:hypothetical protein